MRKYQIFTDATADMCEEMFQGLPHIEVIPMEVIIDDKSYQYGPGGNLTVDEFYAMQRAGKFASTSQINSEVYKTAFESYVKEGWDILYLGFSSGMSGTINSANICAEELEDLYPERMIVCMDTLCASVGEGFLVREAARRQAEGMTLEQLVQWVNKHRLQVAHWFTVDTFQHLLHGGRVSSAAAFMGTVLNIKPLLSVDGEGRLKVIEKPRGNKQALKSKLLHMEGEWKPELGRFVLVGHADCPKIGQELCEKVKESFPDAEVYMTDIGPIIGAHTGPGMSALVFWGDER